MSELDPESTRLLALARTARTPAASDRARVAKRLGLTAGVAGAAAAQTVLAGSAQAAVQTAGGAVAAKGTVGLKVFGAGAAWAPAKLGLAGALLVSAATATYLARDRTSAEAPATVASHAPSAAVAPALVQPSAQPTAAGASPGSTAQPQAPADTENHAQRTVRSARRAAESSTLAAELDLLHRAQAAWREHQPTRALELLSSHRRDYPSSALRAEREALQVLVLCETGEVRQAARLARALLKREPNSPARAAIEESCAATGATARIR
jgi:hypothetical protein